MSTAPRPRNKKRVRKADPDPDPEFQIAPMIDILLVLLVFFMSISSTEVLQSNKSVNLPVAKEAKEAKNNPGQIIINVTYSPATNTTAIEVDERVYRVPSDLTNLLITKATTNPLVRVLIRADRDVRYDFLRQILETVGRAGIGNVTFSVVNKEGHHSS